MKIPTKTSVVEHNSTSPLKHYSPLTLSFPANSFCRYFQEQLVAATAATRIKNFQNNEILHNVAFQIKEKIKNIMKRCFISSTAELKSLTVPELILKIDLNQASLSVLE